MMILFAKRVESFTTKPVFKSITTDFSFALIGSVCLAFNGCDLFHYLEMLYDQEINSKLPSKRVTFLLVCLLCFRLLPYQYVPRIL